MDDAPPPPYTETDIYSHSGRSPAARGESNSNDDAASASSSRSGPIYTPPETPQESHHDFSGLDDHHTVASAHSYFDSRPTLQSRASGPSFVIQLAITEEASPEDFPYPNWAREHDTTEQDWQTFLNYVLPDHSVRSNSQVVDRKLKAEDDAESSKTERSIAEAQLGQIKSSSDLPLRPSRDVDAMIREWNDGFFGPRGVTIQRTPSPSVSGAPFTDRGIETAPSSQPQPQEEAKSRWNPFRSFETTNRGLRIGRLSIDGDRVSFGDSFQADRNGVRWNGLSTEDLRFVPDNGSRDIPRGPGPFNGFPSGRGGFGDHGMGRGRGGRWGRAGHNHHHPYGPRDHSPSSHSSASSGSDSDSDSSIGSLPGWDDLKDNQLPVTKQSISAWLAHPEQPLTREMLKSAKSSIKAARNAPPPTNDPSWDVSKQALRQEVRSLLARVKELKREQKKASRATRRERREQKRAHKREYKERRRAERREHRSHGREFRQAERSMDRNARHGPFNPFDSRPGAPSLPGMPGPHVGGSPGFFGPSFFSGGMRGGPSQPHRPWEAHVQHAQRQAELARSQGLKQAEMARAQGLEQAEMARAQADTARAQALQHAERTRAEALNEAERARAHAQRTAEAARAQAAAAVAAWTRPSPGCDAFPAHPFLHAQAPPQTKAPDDTHTHTHTNRSSKYEEADALEAQIVAKNRELLALEKEEVAAAAAGKSYASGKAEELASEAAALKRDVQRLRFEADEEMARRMAEEEGRLG